MNCFISCCTFTSYNVFVLHSSPLALFAYCNFSLLHFVHFALFPEVLPGSPHTSTMERCATIITKAVKHCCKVLHLRCSWGSGYASAIFILHFFHVAHFPCRTFFMLHSSHAALDYYWKILKMDGRQKTQPKSNLTLSTVNLFHFYFDIATRFVSLYSFEWLTKWKGINLLLCWKRICLPKLKLLN